MQIGTRMLGRAEADAGASPGGGPNVVPGVTPGAVRQPGADGTLLAVVPIPGTGTSLAIVGYPVTAPGDAAAVSVGPIPGGRVPDGAVLDGSVLGGAVPDGVAAPGQPAGGLLLDHDQRRVWADGTEVTLTFQEFELLAFLVAHPATVFSRSDLVRRVWQRDFAADSRTVDVHVSRLRHKLGPSHGRCLVTEYRVGYQFRPVK
ncbi:MAG: winged helix-turn-helix domain-containing protein [Trebonia sp.]